MKHRCPVCHTEDAITTVYSVIGGTYWEPPDVDFEMTDPTCGCTLTEEHEDQLYEIHAADPGHDWEHEYDDVDFDEPPY